MLNFNDLQHVDPTDLQHVDPTDLQHVDPTELHQDNFDIFNQ